ncbi:MAG: PGPGW domain-containing protein [Candidatus Peregrinibacteria bacterium]
MIKMTLRIIVGTFSIVLGIIGFLIPFMPGWLLVFFGIILISPHHGKRVISWVKQKIFRMKTVKEVENK